LLNNLKKLKKYRFKIDVTQKNKKRKYQKYDKMFLTTKTISVWRYFL